MKLKPISRIFSAPRPTRSHFALGIAMVSVIPILLLLYRMNRDNQVLNSADIWFSLTLLTALAFVLTGYVTLRRHPRTILRIRELLEDRIGSDVSHKADLIRSETDAQAIEKGIHILVEELQTRAIETEATTTRLHQKLHLARKLESLNTMALGLAHDFNNHLTAVLGNVAVMRQRLPPESPVQENIEHIESAAMNAVELVNQISLFSGQINEAPRTLDLNALAMESVSILRERLPQSAGIHVELAGEPLPLHGEHGSIRQMLDHLLQNAVDAGHRTGTVTLTTGFAEPTRQELESCIFNEMPAPCRCVCIQIADKGCGIAPELHERIFDPCFSTKMRARGMGLPVALGVVRAHGGAIRVRSKPREGCTLTVLLPATPA